jgi:rhodanese-related sulfurtransferase
MAMREPAGGNSPLIEPDELAARLQSGPAPRIIDVRELNEFVSGHIPDAVNLPLSDFQKLYARLPKQEELILVCRSGNRSGMAQRFLAGQGYSKTRNLIDGMLGWDGPVVRGR